MLEAPLSHPLQPLGSAILMPPLSLALKLLAVLNKEKEARQLLGVNAV